ncbi:hypothetical protein ACPWSH_25370, partial [Pandoraea pneumonica]|uniref:hypothetical protein n=1 Tax=Pandoraea pneumonica TaxID=2508299 RepID=UPI003CFB0D75
ELNKNSKLLHFLLAEEILIARFLMHIKKASLIGILFFAFYTTRLHAQTPPPIGFSTTTVSSNWNQAVGLTFSKSGNQMFVWEKGGRV